MTIGHVNKGESFIVVAAKLSETGYFDTTDTPNLYLSSDITAAGYFVENQPMILSSTVPFFYYQITGDGDEYPPEGFFFGFANFSDGQAPVDILVGDYNSAFAGAMLDYPNHVPPGPDPGPVVAPTTTDTVKVYFHCWHQDNQEPMETITPTCKIVLSPHVYEEKGASIETVTGDYNATNGVWEVLVSPYAKVNVKIPEMGLNLNGYVGAGATVIRADQLYTSDQTP